MMEGARIESVPVLAKGLSFMSAFTVNEPML